MTLAVKQVPENMGYRVYIIKLNSLQNKGQNLVNFNQTLFNFIFQGFQRNKANVENKSGIQTEMYSSFNEVFKLWSLHF